MCGNKKLCTSDPKNLIGQQFGTICGNKNLGISNTQYSIGQQFGTVRGNKFTGKRHYTGGWR